MEDIKLPGYNCGSCSFKSCGDFKNYLLSNPGEIARCIHFKKDVKSGESSESKNTCSWKDALGRNYDFILDVLPGEEGPRENIHLYNPQNIEKLNIKKGDVIVGRPVAAGCPVTHCGKVIEIDEKSGVIEWCVVGPLAARGKPIIDIGGYAPIGFDGLVSESRVELKIGIRYYWMPRRCMLQWRHSGLVAGMVKLKEGYRVKIEGVFLG